MRRITFDYANTCPKIDKLIACAGSEIHAHISDLLDEACPLFDGEAKHRFVSDSAERLYAALEDIFETARSTNEDMRREAERQISDLTDTIASLESDLENHQ